MSPAARYLLDTNTVAFIVNGRSTKARKRLKAEQAHSTVSVSAITQAEILFGLEKKPEATQLRAAIAALFQTLPVLAWDGQAAQAYGVCRTRMAAAGKSLSAMDLLIASHAIATHAVLVTHNKALLQMAPLLNVTDWATDL
jgi:tRNA(fMet)-specific endonuclease VapC